MRDSTFFRGNIRKISNTQMVRNLLEITLRLTVFEIKDIFQRHYIYGLKYSTGPKFLICAKILDSLSNSVNSTFFRGTITKISSTQSVQNLLKITLSVTVFKINNIFDFHQNSRWLIKFGKFSFFIGTTSKLFSFLKIALSLTVFKIHHQNSRM